MQQRIHTGSEGSHIEYRGLFTYGTANQQVSFSLLFYLFNTVYHYFLICYRKTENVDTQRENSACVVV